jgi:hypothetical protein
MADRNLLEEAIADAKAVKEAAIANAKAALEETFSPYLQEKFAAQIAEMELEEMEDEEPKKMAKENYGKEETEEGMDPTYEADSMEEGDDTVDEMNLEELLAELDEELSEMEGNVDEGDETPLNEAEEETDEEEVEMEAGDEEEEIEIEDMTEEDLAKYVEEVIKDMVASGELEAGPNFESDDEDMMGMDMDMNMGDEEIDMNMTMDDEMMAEAKKKMKKQPYGGDKGDIKDKFRGKIKRDTAEDEDKAAYEKKRMKEELEKTKADLGEALKALAEIRVNLQEVNLLNAKLLYTNKIFRAKNLNENQKVKVLGAFDKATTVKEAKLVFETLNNEIRTAKKPAMNESLVRGLASKASGVAPEKKPILEADSQVLRWQKLAGIIKS